MCFRGKSGRRSLGDIGADVACWRSELAVEVSRSLSLSLLMARVPVEHAEFATLSKRELHALADRLIAQELVAVEYCVAFVLAETKGHWHGRARAMMCRRLKHVELGRTNRTKLLACILERLESGEFSEQFKDQLRLALHLDRAQSLRVCESATTSDRPHVRRYAQWALSLPVVHSA